MPFAGFIENIAVDFFLTAQAGKYSVILDDESTDGWAVVRLAAIDDQEMRELVLDAWRMVVPKRVAAEHLGS